MLEESKGKIIVMCFAKESLNEEIFCPAHLFRDIHEEGKENFRYIPSYRKRIC
jgi:hypothetical protein